ncbi:hypothetical protein G6O67_002497 [Ophiocordyceps sinensis]|uniref:FAM192A/Fyv6 N-terminal domain-containing protein n=1 Tax=Ophiocordyceps sinensis TaxID=72228 RepID=A0A8H4V7J9_9HYPO|nr:hypothetical protein G6O67_002497 [Ophiocordyceps sinensis]
MSNRFVSGGTMGSGGEATQGDAANGQLQRTSPPLAAAAKMKPEWEAVQLELEADRKRREEARLKAAAGGEQSLYDILQANKAAKQAAFEEKHKLKNQFRPLDDDEAGFLDEVRERARLDEERVRRETEEGLRAFRRRQRAGDEGGGPARRHEGGDEVEGGGWEVGRKRKRVARERVIKGLGRRVGGEGPGHAPGAREGGDAARGGMAAREPGPVVGQERAREDKKGLSALVDYDSDESD